LKCKYKEKNGRLGGGGRGGEGSENPILIKVKDVWLLFRSHGGNAQLLIWLLRSSGMLALL